MWGFRSELTHFIEKLGIVPLSSRYELKTVLQHADCLSHFLYSEEPDRFFSPIFFSSETVCQVVHLILKTGVGFVPLFG